MPFDWSNIPASLKQILYLSKGELDYLRRDYYLYLGMTVVSAASATGIIALLLLIEKLDTIYRLLFLLISVVLYGQTYILSQETLKKYRYLQQVENIMAKGASFFDGLRKLFGN